MAWFPIRSLQKALTEVRERGANISSPGAIDGVWGTQTERSLDAYLSALTPPYHGEVQVDPEGGGIMVLNNAIMTDLVSLAAAYDTRQAGGIVSSASASLGPAGSAQPNTMIWVGAGLAAVLLIGGAVWWFSKQPQGRR